MTGNSFKFLGYRYWLESRSRFFIAAILLFAITLYIFGHAGSVISLHPGIHAGRIINFTQFVWVVLYKGYFLTIFTLSSFIFGLGGLNQERENGNALFTLSLPVKRISLMQSKIGIASLQVIALSLLSALFVPALAFLYGYHYPISDAFLFSCLITAGGLTFMLLGVFLSLFISKQLLIIPAGLSIMATIYFVTKLPSLKHFNIFSFMTGAGYLNNDDFLFNQNINIPGICLSLLVLFISVPVLGFCARRMDL